jgi:putative membrane protein
MPEAKRLLVLCIDVDDDLGAKAKIHGPVIGRQANIEAASRLALVEPENTDANAMFAAVKEYDELGREHKVEVATITGSERLGYAADREIVSQLERVVNEFKPDAAVFVSDGASDERVIPLIQSRVKINRVSSVVIRQTRELEKTYFVILDKLKEPQFALIIFGIPGLLLLLFAAAEFLGVRLVVGVLGAYLILKAFGVEESLLRRISGAHLSFSHVSSIFSFAAVPLALVSIWLGVSRVFAMQSAGMENVAKLTAWFVKDTLLLLPIAILLVIVGRVVEVTQEKKNYALPNYLVSGCGVALLWLVFNSAAEWVIGTTSFANFFSSLVLSTIVMVLVFALAREFRASMVSRMSLEGKEVYTEVGSQLGKIVGVNKRKSSFIVQTGAGQKIDFALDRITSLGDKIVIRY